MEPGTGGDDHGKAQQDQCHTVAAMSGFDVTRAPDRPCRAPGAPGRHQPGRAQGPAAGQPGRCQQGLVAPPRGRLTRLTGLVGLFRPVLGAADRAVRVALAKWLLTCSFCLRSGQRSDSPCRQA
ncbi:hypothetical protein BZL30_0331 [Mycobacterium kansasii]|uniref:Uncharacterized protein n=1 Tax=Mycobacterium kansasii TaxID=1768 RepID=A0A1V3XRW9_MYCKA|nr:hypothetical protein BZL30_0331 [Mycobacterium kansasii]